MDGMVKILCVNGSPRRGGNTEAVLREAIDAAAKAGAEAEMMSLADYDLKPCTGCDSCFEAGRCAIEDDVEEVFERVRGADSVILASPVYFFNVTAQVKTFIDRVGYLDIARGREPFRNKVGGAVAVAAKTGSSSALSQMALFFSACRMITVAPQVTVLASEKGDASGDARGMDDARELVANVVRVAKATASLREGRRGKAE